MSEPIRLHSDEETRGGQEAGSRQETDTSTTRSRSSGGTSRTESRTEFGLFFRRVTETTLPPGEYDGGEEEDKNKPPSR